MNTYILSWHDEDLDEVRRVKINAVQKKLIDYLINIGINDVLDCSKIRISIKKK